MVILSPFCPQWTSIANSGIIQVFLIAAIMYYQFLLLQYTIDIILLSMVDMDDATTIVLGLIYVK